MCNGTCKRFGLQPRRRNSGLLRIAAGPARRCSQGELIGINTLASSGLDEGVWNIAVDSAVLCVSLIICDD